MSDIYLQITETPTVVTLSAPVVSGALASTVTVANTVTVALDANSLSALENVTVTVGAAVSISNFPATQTIAGTVTANPTGTQTIAGSVTANLVGLSVGQRDSIQTDGAGSIKASLVAGGQTQICNDDGDTFNATNPLPISGTVTANVSSQDLYGQQATTGGSFLRSALYYEDLLAGAGEFLRVHNDSGGGLPIRTASSDVVNVSGTISADLNQPNFVGANGDILDYSVQIGYYDATAGEFRKVDSSVNPLPISGTVTANLSNAFINTSGGYQPVQFSTGLPVANERDGMTFDKIPFLVAGSVTIGSAIPAGTNRIGVVTIGGGTVTIGAGTAQIGSVTASISNSVTIASFATSVTARLINPAGTSVTYAEVGTAGNPSIDVLSVQGVTSGTPLNVYPLQGTSVSNTNFTSITASTTLVSAVANREVLTVFNESGTLFISPGATCTTISYQIRLGSGDYWECPQGQQSLQHAAVYLTTGGTARVCQVS